MGTSHHHTNQSLTHTFSETNLKLRRAKLETNTLRTPELLSTLTATVSADAPNNNLHRFNATIVMPGKEKLVCTQDHVLLRGCVLRNTEWAHGIAVYTGADTKVMLNAGSTIL